MISPVELKLLIWALLCLLGILSWIGRLGVKYLSNIATSVNKIEKDIAVLSTEHINLKEEVRDIKDRVKILENA